MMLFEKFEGSLSDELIENLKGLGDRNLGDTRGAINAIFYTLLAGLIRRANSDMSTNMLVNQIQRIFDKDLKGFDTEDSFSKGKGLSEFVRLGENNMSQIFPSFKSQLLNLVTTHSGTSKSETNKYAGFVNSLVIKFLAEKLRDGISKDDLMNYLKEHRDPLFDKAPETLIDKMIPALGIHDLRNMKLYYAKKKEEKENRTEEVVLESDEEEVSTSETVYEEESSSPINKQTLLIIGVAALVVLLAYFVYNSKEELFGSSEIEESQLIDMAEEEALIADSLAVVAQDALPKEDAGWMAMKELINSSEPISLETEVKMESLRFSADSLDLSNPSNPIVDSLVARFKTNPRFQLQLKGGHAGGNKQIGLKRAFSVKRLLQNKGVDAIRIDAVSDGEDLDYLKIRLVSK